MANFKPIDPPQNLSMDVMRAQVDALGSLARACRFAVRINLSGTNNKLLRMNYGPVLRDLIYMAEATELPGRGLSTQDFRYYGPTFQVPTRSEYQPQEITFLCRNQSMERQLFDDWLEVINPTNNFDFSYKSDYMAEINVFQMSDYAKGPKGENNNRNQADATYAWTIREAFPIAVHPQPVSWAEQDILRLTVVFAYRYWSRNGRDNAPNRKQLIG
jgi:hypothetical protein